MVLVKEAYPTSNVSIEDTTTIVDQRKVPHVVKSRGTFFLSE